MYFLTGVGLVFNKVDLFLYLGIVLLMLKSIVYFLILNLLGWGDNKLFLPSIEEGTETLFVIDWSSALPDLIKEFDLLFGLVLSIE